MKKLGLFIIGMLLVASGAIAQASWNLDPSHTTIGFAVNHMVISEVNGQFKTYEGSLTTTGDDLAGSQISFSADVASIDTENEKRDGHLKSPDFFDAANHPKLTFKSSSVKKTGDDTYKVAGTLTIRGNSKEVEFDLKHNGTIKDPYGNTRAGFKLTGAINRMEYGLKWSAALETGGLVVDDEVRIICNIEAIKS